MNKVKEISEKKTITEYFDSLSKNDRPVFFAAIMTNTRKSQSQVYKYIQGKSLPTFSDREKITAISDGVITWIEDLQSSIN